MTHSRIVTGESKVSINTREILLSPANGERGGTRLLIYPGRCFHERKGIPIADISFAPRAKLQRLAATNQFHRERVVSRFAAVRSARQAREEDSRSSILDGVLDALCARYARRGTGVFFFLSLSLSLSSFFLPFLSLSLFFKGWR